MADKATSVSGKADIPLTAQVVGLVMKHFMETEERFCTDRGSHGLKPDYEEMLPI